MLKLKHKSSVVKFILFSLSQKYYFLRTFRFSSERHCQRKIKFIIEVLSYFYNQINGPIEYIQLRLVIENPT